jgi:hypothetical protein
MVEDLRWRLCNDAHEDQFPLFRLSARYWLSEETFVGIHKSDDVERDAPEPVISGFIGEPPESTLAVDLRRSSHPPASIAGVRQA